jgi:single-strand DNA-binding protein
MIGNLTADPELRYTASGTAVCNFTLAVNTGYSDKKSVLYLPVVVWKQAGENAAQYLSKGRPCLVEGRIEEQTWEKDGQRHRKWELIAFNVTYLGSKDDAKAPDEVTDIEPF